MHYSARLLFVLCASAAAGSMGPWSAASAQPRDHGGAQHRPSVVQTLPHGYHSVRSREREYFVHRGRFYEHRNGGYIVIHPPFGAVVATLPPGYVAVYIGGIRYFFVGGAYFRPEPTGYVIVEPPQPTPAPQEAHLIMVQVGRLNVRQGPGRDFGVAMVVTQGTRLAVYGTAPDWYYVQLPDGTFGWVMVRFTLPISDEPRG